MKILKALALFAMLAFIGYWALWGFAITFLNKAGCGDLVSGR